MSKHQVALWVWLATAFIGGVANAESLNLPETSFAEFRTIILETLKTQPELFLEKSRLEELAQRRTEVAAQRLPQVRFGFENRSDIVSADRTAFDSGNRLDAVVTASQLLYDFGASGYKVAAADLEIEAQRWQRRVIREELVLDLISAHYEVARNQALQSLALTNVEEHKVLVEQVEERVQAGAGSKADLLRARSQWVAARTALTTINGQLRSSERIYHERFQMRSQQLYRVAPGFLKPVQELPSESQTLSTNPRYQSVRQKTESAKFAALGAARDSLPKLSLELQGRRFDVDDSDLAEDDLAVLVSVDYPLYSGGAQSARTRQAAARQAQGEYQQQVLLREITRQEQTARNAITTREEEMALAAESLAADRSVLDAYKAQFQIGRRSLGDVLDAQRDVFESGRRLVNASFDYDLANYSLLQIHGELLPIFEEARGTELQGSGDVHAN